VERLQLSLRREAGEGVTVTPGSYGVEVESIVLGFEPGAKSGARP